LSSTPPKIEREPTSGICPQNGHGFSSLIVFLLSHNIYPSAAIWAELVITISRDEFFFSPFAFAARPNLAIIRHQPGASLNQAVLDILVVDFVILP
jgi:hypothetical protein